MKSLRRLFTAVALPLLVAVIAVGCSSSAKKPTKTLTSIAVTPASPAHLKVGATQQFTATGTYSDSSTADITTTVTWASGTTATATITASGGLATGVAGGTTQITASMGTVTSPGVTLTVIALQSIAITPNPATIAAVGGTLQFTATGTYSDTTTTADITTQVTWNSGTPSVATIGTSTGLATGVSAGGSTITATLGSVVSPGVVLVVGGAVVPVSLKVSPVNPTVIVGGTADFTAVELMSDGSTQAVVGAITWTSGTTATASIFADALTNAGIATGKANGTSTITATFGTLTGNTLLTVSPAVPRFAYTIGPNDGVTSSFAINAPANALAPIAAAVDPGTSLQLVFEPSGHFAYGAGFDGNIRVYSVDPVSGVLSPTGLSGATLPSLSSSTSTGQSIIDPSGRFLYVVDLGTNSVNAFSINVDTTSANYGNVTAIGAVATGSFPLGAAITPNGKFLYVTDSDSAASSISGYSIGADGSLAPITITGTQLTTLSAPSIPTIDPTGQFLYVPNSVASTVTAFSIAASGDLTRIGTTDVNNNLNAPFQAVTNPTGNFLFVTNFGSGNVAAFSVGPTGALTATTTAPSGGSSNSIPEGIAVDPTGSFAIVANNGENTVTLFGLSAGVLTPKFTAGSRVTPLFVNFYSGSASPMIGPSNVFAANSGSGNVSGYVANSTTGVLGTATTAAGQSGNALLAADIAGNFLYSTSASGPSIGGFSVTPSTAALAPVSAFALTTATDVPASVATEPTSRTLLFADTTGNLIETFSAGNSPASSGTTTFASVSDLAVDPQGTYVLAFGSSAITVAQISGSTGTLSCVQQQPPPAPPVLPPCPAGFTQAGNWIAGAVDPTGHWIVALDGAGKALQPIAFTPVQNLFVSPDANLTAQGLPLGTGLTKPSSVTFDPLGRFVFVSDATAGKIAVFSFNEGIGALTALGTPVTVDATGTGKVSVDASGTYLYAAVTGNGGSTPSGVNAYKINADGSLTLVAGSPFAAGAGTTGTAAVVVTSSVK